MIVLSRGEVNRPFGVWRSYVRGVGDGYCMWWWRHDCRRYGSSTSELPLEDGGFLGPEAVESYLLS